MRTLPILLLTWLTTACNSPDRYSEQKAINDTDKVVVTQKGSANNSMYVLDTTFNSNFQGDTAQQIRNTLKLIADFDKVSINFRKDTFSVYEKATEGCEIIAVHDNTTEFIKLYGTLLGELGKSEFRFYLNRRTSKLVCAVFTDYSYDRPKYQKDMQIRDTKTTYQILTNNKLIAVLDENKQRQNLPVKEIQAMENDTRQFFNDYIGQIKIAK